MWFKCGGNHYKPYCPLIKNQSSSIAQSLIQDEDRDIPEEYYQVHSYKERGDESRSDEDVVMMLYDDNDDESVPSIIWYDVDSDDDDDMPELACDDSDSESEEATTCPIVWKCDVQGCSQFNICTDCSKIVICLIVHVKQE